MYQRDHDRCREPGQTRSQSPLPRRSVNPVLALQRAIGDWVAKKDPENLVVTTTKGKHSDELKRMSDSKARIDTIEVQSIVGENSIVVITFRNARIKGYAAGEAGKTEEWKAVDFDAVNRAKTSIGAARP